MESLHLLVHFMKYSEVSVTLAAIFGNTLLANSANFEKGLETGLISCSVILAI